MSLSCSNRPICVDSRLDGYWNMVLDSLVINRSAKVEFGSINFNFTSKNVELPLLQTPRVVPYGYVSQTFNLYIKNPK